MIPLLKNSVLFKGLSDHDIDDTLSRYHHKIKEFDKRDFIFLQNDVCDKLILMIDGVVESNMVDSTGKLIIVGELKSGQLLAPGFLFSEANKYPVTTVVIEKSTVLIFDKNEALKMMQDNGIILQNFLRIISNRSQFLSQKLKFHALMPLRNKISNYLLSEYKRENSVEITLLYTQQELADRFGVARPSFARTLGEMEKEGIIEVIGRKLIIRNLEMLKKLSE